MKLVAFPPIDYVIVLAFFEDEYAELWVPQCAVFPKFLCKLAGEVGALFVSCPAVYGGRQFQSN